MEIGISWNELKDAERAPFILLKGKVIGFDVAIDDNDGKYKIRKIQMVWSSGADACGNTQNYGVLILE